MREGRYLNFNRFGSDSSVGSPSRGNNDVKAVLVGVSVDWAVDEWSEVTIEELGWWGANLEVEATFEAAVRGGVYRDELATP